MKNFSLFLADVDDVLDARLVRTVQLALGNVRINEDGWLLSRPTVEWRMVYRKFLQRQFPHAWIYSGGHHLAVHASPPPDPRVSRMDSPDGTAGKCLFRIVEVKRLHKLACGLHHGEFAGGRCWKCSTGFTAREISTQRDRSLVAALLPA